MSASEATVAQLRQQLLHLRADRHPFEHATVQFHLGVTLLNDGNVESALAVLAVAARLFDEGAHRLEHAKATNMIGVALRTAGRPHEAVGAFERAVAGFAAADAPLERAAAGFNLGLAHRDRGDERAAAVCFSAAAERFEEADAGSQAAGALRELAAVRLAGGRLGEAIAAGQRAVDLAERAGDLAGLGAAANVTGLAQLAAERPDDAVASLRVAAGASPRRLRPDAYAMATANLALAHARAGAAVHARLHARQALGTPGVPQPVAAQARDILRDADRSTASGDLLAVLDAEPAGGWPALLREELARWLDADPAARRSDLGGWIDGLVERGGAAPELAEAWLGTVLEAPPAAMETLLRSLLEAFAERPETDQRQFRSQMSRAMIRFHVPQWMRLRETLNHLAVDLGQEPGWD